MTSASLPFDSEGHRYLADVPMTPGNKQIVFRSHGMETRLTACGRVLIHDHWLDTATGLWASEWRDVTDWSRTKILDFLGY